MKKKKWVVLRLETKSREFQSKTLLAYHLVNRGYGVIISRDYGLKSSVFPRGIYVLNNIYKTNNIRLKKIMKNHNKIIILDEEGLVYVNKEQYLKRVPEENLGLISKFLCFGKEQYDIVSEKFPEYKNKFIITGNPRINLLNDMFSELELDKVESIRKKHGEYFLIVSNFSTVNLFGVERDLKSRFNMIYQKYDELGFLGSDIDILKLRKSFDYINTIFESFLTMSETLAKTFPDMNIIIRPHPSEDRKLWEDIKSRHSNIKIIFDGNLTEWIKGSELVIQNSCTSAIESLFLNKNCVSYRPFSSEAFDQPLPNKLSLNITTINELLDIASEKCSKSTKEFFREKYAQFRKMASQNISYYDKDESLANIISEIEEVNIDETRFNKNIYKRRRLYPRILLPNIYSRFKIESGTIFYELLKSIGYDNNRLYKYLDDKIKNINYLKKYQKNKLQLITTQEINKTMEKYNSIYFKDTQFKIAQIDDESFIVE